MDQDGSAGTPPSHGSSNKAKIAAAYGFVLLGALAGYLVAVLPLRGLVSSFVVEETLGGFVPPERLSTAAKVYEDPKLASEKIRSFTWVGPLTIAPFVDFAPRPGDFNSTHITEGHFRNRNEPKMPKPAGMFRVFLTGGSTAFGTGAPSEDTTPGSLIQEMLQKRYGSDRIELFTLACPGWTSTHERIAIENKLSELAPDLVLSLSGINDAHWGQEGEDTLWFQALADRFHLALINRALRMAFYNPLPGKTRKYPGSTPAAELAAHLEKNVRLSAFVLSAANARFVYALQPISATTHKPLTVDEQAHVKPAARAYFIEVFNEYRERLNGLQATNFKFVDASGVFDRYTADDAIFLDNYHFGDKGNRILAEALAQNLIPLIDESLHEK